MWIPKGKLMAQVRVKQVRNLKDWRMPFYHHILHKVFSGSEAILNSSTKLEEIQTWMAGPLIATLTLAIVPPVLPCRFTFIDIDDYHLCYHIREIRPRIVAAW
ncbi:hypothetical protein NPIL_526351 [Nephila pilipes]|uniref:Uncharacterized protein n=1 Tax=Nephila pilipes TaxID=299642 RepID=A0A8X6U8P8_NEPPI|nr:hypothetical protein NPIL_526351 [Nephila pilipes]